MDCSCCRFPLYERRSVKCREACCLVSLSGGDEAADAAAVALKFPRSSKCTLQAEKLKSDCSCLLSAANDAAAHSGIRFVRCAGTGALATAQRDVAPAQLIAD